MPSASPTILQRRPLRSGWRHGRLQADARLRKRSIATRPDVTFWSTGAYTVPDTRGRVETQLDRTPMLRVRTRASRWRDSFFRTGSRSKPLSPCCERERAQWYSRMLSLAFSAAMLGIESYVVRVVADR